MRISMKTKYEIFKLFKIAYMHYCNGHKMLTKLKLMKISLTCKVQNYQLIPLVNYQHY